jgi:hypothetical protein
MCRSVFVAENSEDTTFFVQHIAIIIAVIDAVERVGGQHRGG